MGDVPDCEWWDMGLVHDDDGGGGGVTALIQHPVPIPPPYYYNTNNNNMTDIMLTKQERKKMRRLRRLAHRQSHQELIRMGLVEPDAPRITITNMHRVYGGGGQQQQDGMNPPTAMEKSVRAEMHARLQKHLDANEARKLTQAQRRDKHVQKWTEDVSVVAQCLIFRLRGVVRPLEMTKLRVNAKEYHFHGVMVVFGQLTVGIVLGGPIGIRRYHHLLLNRIQWPNKGDQHADHQHADHEGNTHDVECEVVWHGDVAGGQFGEFKVVPCATEDEVKELLGDKYGWYEVAKYYQPAK
jgi:U4/U6 small nuclear ribonucleoprotein PRP3